MFVKKIGKIFLTNIILLIILIGSIELYFGYWFDKDNLGPYMREHRMKNQRILWNDEIEEFSYFYRRNYYGFRGKDINPSEIKGVILGSSLIDERYKPEKYTITEFLNKRLEENNLDINFINAGIEGQTSAGMVASFEKWLYKLENFSPKYILFYLGINDSLHHSINISEETSGHLLNPERKEIFFDNIKTRSIIYDSIRKIKFKHLPRDGFVEYNGEMPKDYINNYNFVKYDTLKKEDSLTTHILDNKKKFLFT